MDWWGILLIVLGGLGAVVILALIYWNNVIRVVRYTYESSRLPKSFDGFKVAHVSDYHNKFYGKGAKRVVEKIAREKPDIIVITGDLIHTERKKNALALTAALAGIAPVYYVSGNHERYVDGYTVFKEEMKELGVRVLDDETVLLERSGERIALSGAIDPRFYMERGFERVEVFCNRIASLRQEGEFNILLSHRPEFMRAYVNAGFDLVLSGHAHAGQVRFPFFGAVFTPGEKFRPHYVVGRYDEKGTTMIVSGGLGSSSAIPRVLNRPQLLFETLRSVNAEK